MSKKSLKAFLFCLFLKLSSTISIVDSGSKEIVRRHEVLQDGIYEVWWTVDFSTEEIEFNISVKTTGFIGFGISYTGSMMDADMIIGGVYINGSDYFSDRHGVGNSTPLVDEIQNWQLVSAIETVTHTNLIVNRKLDTCDYPNDIPINDDTLKIIWSYGNTDDLGYHGSDQRGIRAVNFRDHPSESPDLSKFQTWRAAQPFSVPANDTTYWCSFFKGPQLTKKHHVVGFDVYLNGTESHNHTHHVDLFKCTPPNGEDPDEYFGKYLGNGYDCYFDSEYFPVDHCELFEYQWSIGGKVTMFPDDVGIPIGESESEYYMTEVHYDNPQQLSGLEADSGMELYYTDKLRENEVGFLMIGVTSSKTYSLTIPPNSQNFVAISHCPSDCTSNWPNEGINAFVYLLHSHLSGRKQKIRHFRGDKELPWLANDEHYDFNYQNNRPFLHQVKLLPGDHLTLECTYDTTWKNGLVTLGGRASRDEMCQTFLMYYPRELQVNMCGSYFGREEMLEYMGLEEVAAEQGINDPTIIRPDNLKGGLYSTYVQGMDWTSEKRSEYQEMVRFSNQKAYCYPFHTNDSYMDVKYPVVDEEYKPPSTCQKNIESSAAVLERSLFSSLLTLVVLYCKI